MSLLKYNNDLLLSPGGNYALRMPPTAWEASGSWILIGHNEVDDAALHQYWSFFPNVSYARDVPSQWIMPKSSWYSGYGIASAYRLAPSAFSPSAQFSGNSFYFNCNLVTKAEVNLKLTAKKAMFEPRILVSAGYNTLGQPIPGSTATNYLTFPSSGNMKFSRTGYSAFPLSSIGSFTSGTVNGIMYHSNYTNNAYDWNTIVNGRNEAYVNQWYASGKMPNGWVLGSPTISVG
jgi:hypothetical protein